MTFATLLHDAQGESVSRGTVDLSMSIQDVMRALHEQQFTGRISIYLRNGKCEIVELPNPIKIQIA